MAYNPKDYYFKKAKSENYAARSVFKLQEIDRRFLAHVRERVPGDEDLVRRIAVIDRSGEGAVRMAATVKACNYGPRYSRLD